MKLNHDLTTLSLETLLQLIVVGNQNLLESKRDYNAHNLSLVYQQVLDQIQIEIVSKQAELPSLE